MKKTEDITPLNKSENVRFYTEKCGFQIVCTERDGDTELARFLMDPEKAKSRGQELVNGCMLYMNGVLRLVSRTDEEWAKIFEPFFTVKRLEHFAWAGEPEETRRLFFLRKT